MEDDHVAVVLGVPASVALRGLARRLDDDDSELGFDRPCAWSSFPPLSPPVSRWTQIGMHLVFGAVVLLACAVLFYLNVFGGGDAKVIAAASLWTGLSAMAPVRHGHGDRGRRCSRRSARPAPDESLDHASRGSKRLLSPEEGAPYAVAIAAGALLVAARIRPFWLLELQSFSA